mmetsp:Transcript_21181/g.65679  ORF Transcript_21181/g.65679 Transcript_21181/m.65679 type:complete len:589 (-) Transcript_21181:89-1855(-)
MPIAPVVSAIVGGLIIILGAMSLLIWRRKRHGFGSAHHQRLRSSSVIAHEPPWPSGPSLGANGALVRMAMGRKGSAGAGGVAGGTGDQEWLIPWSELSDVGKKKLGEGAFGKVVTGFWARKGTKVAIKLLTSLEDKCEQLRQATTEAEECGLHATTGHPLSLRPLPDPPTCSRLSEYESGITADLGCQTPLSAGSTVDSSTARALSLDEQPVVSTHRNTSMHGDAMAGMRAGMAVHFNDQQQPWQCGLNLKFSTRDKREIDQISDHCVINADGDADGTCAEVASEGSTDSTAAATEIARLEREYASEIATFEAEVDMLFSLRHPNIVLLMGACIEKGHAAMVMELAHTNLDVLLHKTIKPITRRQRFNMIVGTASGVAYLHAQSPPIIHRDLKPANLLLSRSGEVRICDFHLSRTIERSLVVASTVGTPGYMSPETLANKPYNERVDQWAFGLIMFEILTRKRPYANYGNPIVLLNQVITHGVHPSLPNPVDGFDADMLQLYEDCMRYDPAKRPSFTRIVERLQEIEGRHCALLQRTSSATDCKASASSSDKSGVMLPCDVEAGGLGLLGMWPANQPPPRAIELTQHR